jgi:two-component system OmpR family response regulator
MLTAKGEEIDRIIGLELGADDYLPKPFNPRELLARIRAVLRRKHSKSSNAPITAATSLLFAGWQLDLCLRRLTNPEGASIMLTGAEFELLHAFCEHPNRVLSRDQLLDMTQGRGTAGPFDRSIDVLVSRIRQKLEKAPRDPELIKTIRTGGYLFSCAVTRK